MWTTYISPQRQCPSLIWTIGDDDFELVSRNAGHDLGETESLEIDQIAENLIISTLSTSCRDLWLFNAYLNCVLQQIIPIC